MTEDRPADDGRAQRREPASTPSVVPHLEKPFDRDRDPMQFGRVIALADGVFAIALTLLGLTTPYLGFVVLIPFAQGALGARPDEPLSSRSTAPSLGAPGLAGGAPSGR